MSLDEMFETVRFAGSEHLPRDEFGLHQLHDEDENELSRKAFWDADVIPEDEVN